jgi:hypothetical protein
MSLAAIGATEYFLLHPNKKGHLVEILEIMLVASHKGQQKIKRNNNNGKHKRI